jgi:uncharacterized protein
VGGEAVVRPVARSERIELLDMLRGFALLGILLANFEGTPGQLIPKIDSAITAGIHYLVSDSFRPLYAFLFGLSFALQLMRARAGDARVVGVYYRRMLALLLIGTTHLVLIWPGDILVQYALLGLVLIPLYLLPLRALLVAILLLFAYQAGENAIANWRDVSAETQQAAMLRGAEARERHDARDAMRIHDDGVRVSFGTQAISRWRTYSARVVRYLDWRNIIADDLLLLFMIGLYVGQKRWIQDAHLHRRRLAMSALAASALAVIGTIFADSVSDASDNLVYIAEVVPNWSVTFAYVAGIAFFVTSTTTRAARWFVVFVPAGMMGLSNYLLQSLVMTWPFLSYGLGLPKPGTTLWVLINFVFFFLVQVPLSAWWMARFRFGPAEWLWRCLTYGELQPMRRAAPTS